MIPDEPACWSWPVPQGSADDAWAWLHDFHQGRCAICGDEKPGLVTDHDHYTGYVRGKLCSFCNAQEGRRTTLRIAAYRERHPAAILGVEVIYEAPLWDYELDAGKFHDREEAGVWGHNAAARIGL